MAGGVERLHPAIGFLQHQRQGLTGRGDLRTAGGAGVVAAAAVRQLVGHVLAAAVAAEQFDFRHRPSQRLHLPAALGTKVAPLHPFGLGCVGRGYFRAALAATKRQLDADLDRGVPHRDPIAIPQIDRRITPPGGCLRAFVPFTATVLDAVDVGSVQAPQVAHASVWRIDLQNKVMPRDESVLGQFSVAVSCPAKEKNIVPVKTEIRPADRAGDDFQIHAGRQDKAPNNKSMSAELDQSIFRRTPTRNMDDAGSRTSCRHRHQTIAGSRMIPACPEIVAFSQKLDRALLGREDLREPGVRWAGGFPISLRQNCALTCHSATGGFRCCHADRASFNNRGGRGQESLASRAQCPHRPQP